MAKFVFSPQYESALREIEDFIFESTQDLAFVEHFLDEHDRVLAFIEHNPDTPAVHPKTGDQSWPFDDGRYRIFFRVFKGETLTVYLADVIDNKRANLGLFPEHEMPTYHED